MSDSPWKLDGFAAKLSLDALRATLDLRQPEGGLQELTLGAPALPAHLLGVLLKPHVATTPSDCYVREADLVATYAEHSARALRVQTYWRCESHVDRLAVELQVSVQTDQLGIATPIVTCSQLEVVEALRLADVASADFSTLSLEAAARNLTPQNGSGCLLFRLPQSTRSYVEMIHAADFQHDRLSFSNTSTGARRANLEHHLFPGTLEKGVILRARIRGLFVPRDNDCALASADYQQFLHSALPLTT